MWLIMRQQKRSAVPSLRQSKFNPDTARQVLITSRKLQLRGVLAFYDLITATTDFAVQKLPEQVPNNELFRDNFGFWFAMDETAVKINDPQKYLLFVLQSGIVVDQFATE